MPASMLVGSHSTAGWRIDFVVFITGKNQIHLKTINLKIRK